jgi:exopolyphosphatase/pppGpp-phosphohydrolase
MFRPVLGSKERADDIDERELVGTAIGSGGGLRTMAQMMMMMMIMDR